MCDLKWIEIAIIARFPYGKGCTCLVSTASQKSIKSQVTKFPHYVKQNEQDIILPNEFKDFFPFIVWNAITMYRKMLPEGKR